jgi:hypothetical protein
MRMRALVFLALSILVPLHARGADVFGNGVVTNSAIIGGGGVTFNANNAWAIPFETQLSNLADRTLQGAWVLVGGETTAVTFSVSIFDDAGTNAGPTGSALASGSLSIGAGAPIDWRFVTFSSSVVLAASDSFYVSVSESVPSTNFQWAEPLVNTSYSNLGSGSQYRITGGNESTAFPYRRNGSTWTVNSNPVSVDSFGVQLVSVPEPSTVILSGTAVMALAFARRRKRS